MVETIKIKQITIGDDKPVRLMAAINLSQESFYKGSIVNFSNEKELEKKFLHFLEQGAEIFDLGPKSTAPTNIYGTETVISPQEEIKRIQPSLNVLRNIDSDIIISVDTQSSKVAEYALNKGADIINDISGLKLDKNMINVLADHSAFVIVMATNHNPGDVYKKDEVIKALSSSIQKAQEFIPKRNIIIDPGIGGWVPERTPEDDFKLILDTPQIKQQLQVPALIALSRKSFIGKTLNLPPNERLYGSISATAISVLNGANIIRTHDVRETKEAIIIAEKFKELLIH